MKFNILLHYSKNTSNLIGECLSISNEGSHIKIIDTKNVLLDNDPIKDAVNLFINNSVCALLTTDENITLEPDKKNDK